jgi:hypothetical protein
LEEECFGELMGEVAEVRFFEIGKGEIEQRHGCLCCQGWIVLWEGCVCVGEPSGNLLGTFPGKEHSGNLLGTFPGKEHSRNIPWERTFQEPSGNIPWERTFQEPSGNIPWKGMGKRMPDVFIFFLQGFYSPPGTHATWMSLFCLYKGYTPPTKNKKLEIIRI